ncbi:uncharacterized protein LOC108052696 [Drosophila rhopaloa]|uniref:Uncharacterized protein LOC108052696 n=1 Tax=Drosophila rhopaloa TaxID=1041015 RepID=A0A6P4FJE2_DRORH|nr:uncharacterized protein LOC108052696 [Drosophila rhopaloa]
MPLFKKFCYCFSLRTGALVVACSNIIVDITDTALTIYTKDYFCYEMLVIMIISTIWNIFSEMILMTAIFRANPKLLPVHLVTCLGSLIFRMISHMLSASLGRSNFLLVTYAFLMVGYVAADVLIVLSYYHSEI